MNQPEANNSPLTEDEEGIELSAEELAGEVETEIVEEQNEEDALKDQLMRTLAEMENVKKRAQRDIEENKKFAVTGFARQMVSVLENLQRASQSIPEEARNENEQVKNLADGVDMTLRELLSVFEKNGIQRVAPEKGEKFDHNLHQAMTQIEDPEAEPGSVLQLMQAGYTIHGRLLQPAMVVVAKRGEAPAQIDTEA